MSALKKSLAMSRFLLDPKEADGSARLNPCRTADAGRRITVNNRLPQFRVLSTLVHRKWQPTLAMTEKSCSS